MLRRPSFFAPCIWRCRYSPMPAERPRPTPPLGQFVEHLHPLDELGKHILEGRQLIALLVDHLLRGLVDSAGIVQLGGRPGNLALRRLRSLPKRARSPLAVSISSFQGKIRLRHGADRRGRLGRNLAAVAQHHHPGPRPASGNTRQLIRGSLPLASHAARWLCARRTSISERMLRTARDQLPSRPLHELLLLRITHAVVPRGQEREITMLSPAPGKL